MQQNSMGEKHSLTFDGEEVPGLINVSEIAREKDSIEAPFPDKKREITNGVSKIPAIELTYRNDRGTNTKKFFQNWYDNNEVKDGVLVKKDAHGVEFERILLPKCECAKDGGPAYDAAAPGLATITTKILPWDYIPVDV